MVSLNRRFWKDKLSFLLPVMPYGVLESWDDLSPRLYLAVHIYWLKFYGMWYNSHHPCSPWFWMQWLYGLVVLGLVCFLPGIGEVVYLLRRRDNIGDIADGLYLFLSEMYTYFKIAVFWLNKHKIIQLLQFMNCEEFKPKESEHRDILRKSINTARFVMTWYSTICVGAVSVGIIMPLTENFDILPTNVEYPYVDVLKSPAYGIIYLHHIYYKPATCIIDGVMDTILAAFIASAIGQIEILAFNLRKFDMLAKRRQKRFKTESINGEIPSKEFDEKSILKDCIKHHNSIVRLGALELKEPGLNYMIEVDARTLFCISIYLDRWRYGCELLFCFVDRYVSLIESAFSLASALQFMLSVMVLCLIGIQFLSIENPSSHPMQIVWMGIYLTCMLIEVFILCWFGDELIFKSNSLREAAYEGPWLTTDPETAMIIVIFQERCKQPLKVTAGKIFTLSLNTYTQLINWAYKAFAVMRNMKHK